MQRWQMFLLASPSFIALACGSKHAPNDAVGGGSSTAGTSSGGAQAGGTSNWAGASNGLAGGGSGGAGATAGSGPLPSGGSLNAGGAASAGAAGSSGSGGAELTWVDPCRGTAATGYVADGLCASPVGTVNNARQIAFSSNGDLWVVSVNGQIRRLRDANANGSYEAAEIVVWASTGGNGQNVHLDEQAGYLYSGTTAGVRRWKWSAALDAGGDGEEVMIGQPGNANHPKHTVHVWDGMMYVMSGSSGNASNENTDKSQYDTQRSVIKRFKLADFTPGTPFQWSAGEVFVKGIRNTLGFALDGMGRMYGVQNGQDDLFYGGQDVHTNNPGEVIVRLEPGSSHGYPFCFVAQQVSGKTLGAQLKSEAYANNSKDDAWCAANAAPPVTFVQAHSAPMEILFFTQASRSLPERWKNGAFVSLHGSWNRNPGSGKKVIWVPFNADGTSPLPTASGDSVNFPYEVVYGESQDKVASGAGQTSNGGLRPVGLAVSPLDGALYISSDGDGKLYRVGLKQRP